MLSTSYSRTLYACIYVWLFYMMPTHYIYRSQLYLTFKDELDKLEARARPIVQEFRRLVEEDQNLDVRF